AETKDEGGRMKAEGSTIHPSSFILHPLPDLLSKRARAYEALKDWGAAAADWSRAAANPDGGKLLADFAGRLSAAGRPLLANDLFEKAQALYERLLEAEPGSDVVGSDLAQMLFDRAEARGQPDWVVLKPAETQTAGTPELAVQDDGSIHVAAASQPEP